jgi:ankyrin repeat protein
MDAVCLLLQHGAEAQIKDRFGATPLDDALREKRYDIAALLRANRATVGRVELLQAQLFDACAQGNAQAVRRLMAKDENGNFLQQSAQIDPNWSVTSTRSEFVSCAIRLSHLICVCVVISLCP